MSPTPADPTATTPPPKQDAKGRFVNGNRGGPGNPYARQCAAFRQAIHDAVTVDDFRALAADLLIMARSGNLAAMKLLFAYAIGKPAEAPHPDRMELEDWKQLQEEVRYTAEDVHTAIGGMPVDLWTEPIRIAQRARRGQARAELVGRLGFAPDGTDLRLVNPQPSESPSVPEEHGRSAAAAGKPTARAASSSGGAPLTNGNSGKAAAGAPIANGFSGPTAEEDRLLQAFRRLLAEEG